MAIYTNNPLVKVLEKESLNLSVLLASHVLEIIGVNNPDYQPKFVLPSLPVVVPSEMLRLLEDCDIRILVRDHLRDVSGAKNTPFFSRKLHMKIITYGLPMICFYMYRITTKDLPFRGKI